MLSFPELEALGCCTCPIQTPFQLQRLATLRCFVLVNLVITPHEDGTLPPLTELTLEWVGNFNAWWLPPKMLGCLRLLVRTSLRDETTQTRIIKVNNPLLLVATGFINSDPTGRLGAASRLSGPSTSTSISASRPQRHDNGLTPHNSAKARLLDFPRDPLDAVACSNPGQIFRRARAPSPARRRSRASCICYVREYAYFHSSNRSGELSYFSCFHSR